MGGAGIIHPQDCLRVHPDNLLSTAMKSRRTIKFHPNFMNPPSRTPNFTIPDSGRTPSKGILKKNDRNTEAMAAEQPVATASKNLVSGQVKILKRGDVLNESSRILREVNGRKVSNGIASTMGKDLVADQEASKVVISGRRFLPAKKQKKKEKDKKMFMYSNSEVDLVLSSTRRMGPDPEMVSNQMKNITECFAGSAFADSPSPSSVPLPGFFKKKFVESVKDEATADLRRILGLRLCRYPIH